MRIIWPGLPGVLLILAGCAAEPSLHLAAPVAQTGVATSTTLLVATTRQGVTDAARIFGGGRASTLSFLEADISVPTARKVGSLEPYRTGPVNLSKVFAATDQRPIADSNAFKAALDTALGQSPADARAILIYVHGYNRTFPETVFRLAQIRRDYGFDGVGLLYSWPSAGELRSYAYDRESALYARDGLTELLALTGRSEARKVFLFGHSMGAFVAMESLRSLKLAGREDVLNQLSAVVLTGADIDFDLFRAQLQTLGTPRPPIFVLGSDEDRLILVSALIRGGTPRLGDGNNRQALLDLGVNFVDLSETSDRGPVGHDIFATAPSVIRFIREEILSADHAGL